MLENARNRAVGLVFRRHGLCNSTCVRSRSLLFLAGLVAVSGVIGCRAREVPGDGSPPGVVLLIIDTLRWDALSPRADGTPRVPSLSRFAAEGVTFTEASATAPWTLPSIASALSGLLPRRHGAQLAFNDAAMRRVPPGVVMLAEVFEANGWSTAACTAGGWVAPELGLGTGFDQFTTNFDLHDPEFFLEPWEAKRPKDRPFFLMLHTGAPHDPYGDKDLPIRLQCRPNPEVKEVARKLVASIDAGQPVDDLLYADFVATRTSDPCSRKAIDLLLGPSRTATLMGPYNQWMAGGWQRAPSANLPTRMRTAYERGLAYVDRRIDHTLKTLDSLGLPKDTVFMVVADHGESFGEHGHLYHGQSMHDAVLKVPFVIRAPKRLPAGRVVRDGCSLVDRRARTAAGARHQAVRRRVLPRGGPNAVGDRGEVWADAAAAELSVGDGGRARLGSRTRSAGGGGCPSTRAETALAQGNFARSAKLVPATVFPRDVVARWTPPDALHVDFGELHAF